MTHNLIQKRIIMNHNPYNDDEDNFYEDNVDFNDPLKELIMKEEPNLGSNDYREASLHFIRIMSLAVSYILNHRNPTTAAYGVAYALELPCVADKSMRELGRELGISSGTISYCAKSFRQIAGLPEQISYNKLKNSKKNQ